MCTAASLWRSQLPSPYFPTNGSCCRRQSNGLETGCHRKLKVQNTFRYKSCLSALIYHNLTIDNNQPDTIADAPNGRKGAVAQVVALTCLPCVHVCKQTKVNNSTQCCQSDTSNTLDQSSSNACCNCIGNSKANHGKPYFRNAPTTGNKRLWCKEKRAFD